MLVYNLTKDEVTYKGRKIPPNGGCVDFLDLTFIPNRDRELETKKVLAFGCLPTWWNLQEALKTTVTGVVMKAGEMNANGDVYPKNVTVTMEAPAELIHESKPVSMSTSQKKK